jgi:hypothetical protein
MRWTLFFIFLFSHSVYFAYNLWVAKIAPAQQFMGTTFNSYWTLSAATLLAATPLLTAANYTFALGFHLGHKTFGSINTVIVFFLAAQFIAMNLLPLLILGESPTSRSLLAFVFISIGLYLSMTSNGG